MENKNEQNMANEENMINNYNDFSKHLLKRRAPFLIFFGIMATIIGISCFVVDINKEETDIVTLLVDLMGVTLGLLLSVGFIRFLLKMKKEQQHQENA